jgi:hypothetical protein
LAEQNSTLEPDQFRRNAVLQRQKGDQYGRLLVFVGYKGWMSLIAIALLIAAAAYWMLTASIPVRVSGHGILLQNVHDTLSSSAGTDGGLQAVLFLQPDEGQRVQNGMRANLDPLCVDSEDYGYMLGHVSAVSQFPVTSDKIAELTGNSDLAGEWTAKGPLIQITVSLEPDSSTLSGYRWSSRDGPDMKMHAGILCEGEVILTTQTPIELVLPGKPAHLNSTGH